MFCSKCGAEIPEGSVKCPTCDTAENAAEVESTVSKQIAVPKKKSKLGIIVAVAVLIAAGIAAFLFFGGKETDPVKLVVGEWTIQEISVGADGEPLPTNPIPFYVNSDGTMYCKVADGVEFNLTWSVSPEPREDGSPYYEIESGGSTSGGMLLDIKDDTLTIGISSSADSKTLFFVCTRAE